MLGAGGYLGRHLVHALSRRGGEVAAPGRDVDVRDRDAVARAVSGADVVYHFAGASGTAASFEDPRRFVEANELGLLNALDAVRRDPRRPKLVFPSTRLVYRGAPGPLPEDAELAPRTVYAVSKLACERYLEAYARAFGVRHVVLRICVPYGEVVAGKRSYGTVGAFLESARAGQELGVYGGGAQRRSLIHVEDLTELVIRAAESPRTDGGTFNAGGPDDLSIREIAAAIAAAYGVRVVERAWDALAERIESGDTVFDSTRLETLTGHACRHRFADWVTSSRIAMSRA